MFWPRRNLFRHLLLRRLCSSLALVAYVMATIGFPLPAPAHKEQSQAFPCQDHPCGCRTAENCWRHCCCFTAEERWAWARNHDVQPPAYAEKPSAGGWQTVRLRERDRAGAKAGVSCCSSHVSPRGRASSCCPKHHGRSHAAPADRTAPPKDAAPAPRSKLRWHFGLNAANCQGLSNLWVSAGAVLPPPALITWSPCEVRLGWLADSGTDAVPAAICPPIPPPRAPVL